MLAQFLDGRCLWTGRGRRSEDAVRLDPAPDPNSARSQHQRQREGLGCHVYQRKTMGEMCLDDDEIDVLGVGGAGVTDFDAQQFPSAGFGYCQ
jgi:hypothetical protein